MEFIKNNKASGLANPLAFNYMKIKSFFIFLSILFITITGYGQKKNCSDSSIRVKYIFGNNGAVLFINSDTTGSNIFTGDYTEGANTGIAMLRTNWGDSMLWAKKLYIPGKDVANRNSFSAPNGTIICTGIWGGAINNNPEILISRIDTSGNLLWANRFKLTSGHIYYNPDNNQIKNILVTNNAIYFTSTFNSLFSVSAKLDLNGNIIWSKSFWMNNPFSSGFGNIPVLQNNTVVLMGSAVNQQTPGPGSEQYIVFTKLNDIDGSLIGSEAYKVTPDALIKGVSPSFLKLNPDNSLSLTGFINIEVIPGTGIYSASNMVFNTLLDNNLNLVHNYYYKNNIPLDQADTYFDFNNQKQHSFLSGNLFNPSDKYFVTFDKNDGILHSRKFSLPTSYGTIFRNSLNFDDKENLHFVYQYRQLNQFVNEYARISSFAQSSTVSCIGKDTNILSQTPFVLTKESFSWNNVISDVLTSNPVIFTEDTAIVTKELVCKIVSICDSLKIIGPTEVCSNQPVRYSFTKNSQCLKERQWVVDTAFVNIISYEADSAFTISFKKSFAGYIKSNIYNCVVQDSLFVTAADPMPAVSFVKRDSLLCPGKPVVLKTGKGYRQYLWQDGSSADSVVVNLPGHYKVIATDSCGNVSTDSINIKLSDTSLFIPATQTICRYDTVYIPLPDDLTNITWQPTSGSILSNKTLLLYPLQNTAYSITAERLANCPMVRNTTVTVKLCPEIVFIPNSFTPNNDGLNDLFKATATKPLQSFRLTVFNRYGQKIFETGNPARGWDGNFKNSKQPSGGYVYQCSYRFSSGYQKNERGYFLLIR